MSNLIPEPRVNKHGVTVIKHVRADRKKEPGLLARLIPALNGAAKAERDQKIEERKQLLSGIKKELYTSPNDIESVEYIASRLSDMKLETLKKINDVLGGTGQMEKKLREFPYEEKNLRVALNFPQRNWRTAGTDRIIQDVAEVLEVDRLDDLDPATDDYAIADLLIKACNDIHLKRILSEPLGRDYDDPEGPSKWDRTQMTTDFAVIVLNFPDRLDDIAEYLASRKLEMDTVDTEHLRIYLDTAAPALAEGAL